MARQSKNRKLREAIAVVGEGVTEWCYFENLKRKEHLTIHLKPELPSHSGWQAVVSKAKMLLVQEFDKVYCIIDYDTIVAERQIGKYEKLKHGCSPKIVFIENNPCFEIWFLLHFRYSSKPYVNCDSVSLDLKRFILEYAKTEQYFIRKEMYSFLLPLLPTALENAKRLSEEKGIGSVELTPYFPKSEMERVLKYILSLP